MNEIINSRATPAPLPAPRIAIVVRPGTMDDLPFIDALQKKHSKQLGFMHRAALEGKVRLGHVLIAEVARDEETQRRRDEVNAASAHSVSSSLGLSASSPAGYLIGNDRYKHRDELGVIFQMCVVPEYRRSLVAAHLLRAQFERSAYGCKLYCCWCAQDIEANRFWESMGFVPIAFRAGSAKRGRLHIFWQKRIRAGDTETPWWFPSETTGGMMDASRIALPIPPGMHWSDELPRLIPEAPLARDGETERPRDEGHRKAKQAVEDSGGGLWFGRPKAIPVREKPAKPKRVKKANPELAAKARELRDRYLEQFNNAQGNDMGQMLPSGRYDVAREIDTRAIGALGAIDGSLVKALPLSTKDVAA